MSTKNFSWRPFYVYSSPGLSKTRYRSSHKMTSSAHPSGQAARQWGGPAQTLRLGWDWRLETGQSRAVISAVNTEHNTESGNQWQPQHGRLGDVPQGEGHLRPEQVRGGPQRVGISSWGNECHCHNSPGQVFLDFILSVMSVCTILRW